MDKHLVRLLFRGILIGAALALVLDAATFGHLGFDGFIYSEDGGLLAALIAVCLGFPLNLLLVNTLDALPNWLNPNRFLEFGIVLNAAILAAGVSAFRVRAQERRRIDSLGKTTRD